MKLIVRQGENEREVEVEREGGIAHVRIDGVSLEVDVRRSRGGVYSLISNGHQHEITVASLSNDRFQVSGSFGTFAAEVVDPLTHLAAAAHEARVGTGRTRMGAYMPGRVVSLLIEEGAQVAAGDGVLVLEAMKMENEIQAERAGLIGKIFVEPGQAVEAGDPLYEIE